MWFFGFSTTNPKSLWTMSVILLVMFLALVLRQILVYLEAKEAKCSSKCVTKEGEKQCHETLKSTAVVRTYGLEELRMATRDFRVQIGVGATSFVYLAELGDGRFGAVKSVMEERGGSNKVFFDEVSVLLRISHPNLVGLMGFCLERGKAQEKVDPLNLLIISIFLIGLCLIHLGLILLTLAKVHRQLGL